MKILLTFLLSGMFMFHLHSNAVACSLSPTAVIETSPSGTVFYHGELIAFDGAAPLMKLIYRQPPVVNFFPVPFVFSLYY